MVLIFSTESSGEAEFTRFSHKAAFNFGNRQPWKELHSHHNWLPLELSGLPAAVQTQVYFGNWLLDGGVGCQHFPQAGWCHTSFWHEQEGILVLHQGIGCSVKSSSPDSTASSGRLMGHFPLCFSRMIFAEMRKGGGTAQAGFSFGGSRTLPNTAAGDVSGLETVGFMHSMPFGLK